MQLMTDLEAQEFAKSWGVKAVFSDGVCKIIDPQNDKILGSGRSWEEAIVNSKKAAANDQLPPTSGL